MRQLLSAPLVEALCSAPASIVRFNRPTGSRTGVLSNSAIIWTGLGQRFRCLLARLARRSLRNRVFAEGAGGHVTPDTS